MVEQAVCPDCNGTGRVEHLDWIEFRERVMPIEGMPDLCEQAPCPSPARWLIQGDSEFYPVCDDHAGVPAEPETVPCSECEGIAWPETVDPETGELLEVPWGVE